jgi:hypothetical protein
MLKFTPNDLKQLEENCREKLPQAQNVYNGNTFRQDLKQGYLIKERFRIVKKKDMVKIKEIPENLELKECQKVGGLKSLQELLK